MSGRPQVPGFRLVHQLGRGASATVWAAVREPDGQRFAVKVVPAGDDGTLPAQALRELAVLRDVRVDHLVRLHLVLRLDDGGVALVVDLAEGGTLSSLVTARGHLHPGEVVTVLTPVCRAAAALHAAGVVHGDLSPGNVLFTARGRPMVGDLGVAGITGERREVVHATPGFVAPEVLDGGAPTPASDTYSIGALLWYAVVGSAPSPLAGRDRLATVVPGLPPTLAALADQALSPDPDARPLADELASLLFDTVAAVPVRLAHGSDDASRLTHRIRAEAAQAAAVRQEARHRSPRRLLGPRRPRSLVRAGPLKLPASLRQGGTRPAGVPDGRLRALWLRAVSWSAGGHRAVGIRAVSVLAAAAVLIVAAAGLTGLPAGGPDGNPAANPDTNLAANPATPAANPDTATGTGTGTSAAHGRASPREDVSDAGRAAAPVRDPDAAWQRTTELVQQLADRRAAALAAGDAGALASVFQPASPVLAADRRTIEDARRAAATYVGLQLSVREASYVSGAEATAVVRARIDTSAYRTDFADGRRRRAPAHASGLLRLTLAWSDDGWRIARLEPG